MGLNRMSEILLDKSAFLSNLTKISQKLGGKEKIMLIAKDNSYGHGSTQIAGIAREFGIKKAVVKSEMEAEQISEFYDEILILSHIPTGCEKPDFSYAINDMSHFSKIKNGSRVHIGVDTLMHRNGILPEQLDDALRLVRENHLNLGGFYTHFRASDEIGSDFFVQRENWRNFKISAQKKCKNLGFNVVFHSCNSAAIERSEEFSDDFARVGMAQFGYFQFNEILGLKPVLSLYADRISSRLLKKGERVGYGGVFEAPCDILIATYDLGYGDGLLRYNGKGDLRLGNNEKILGKMSMDSFASKDAGERVCVFDDARVWARFFNTIEYEILVKLSANIKRTVK